MSNAKREELKDKVKTIIIGFDNGKWYDSKTESIMKLIDQQVLSALEKVKSNKELLYDKYKDAPLNAVPLSVIEEIEKEYRNDPATNER